MNQIWIDGYMRVTRTKASRLFEQGKTIRICACKMSPVEDSRDDYADINRKNTNSITFKDIVNVFEHYRCISSETGYYPSFYVKEI